MTQTSDTHPDIDRMQIEMMRQAPAWRKIDMVGQMFAATKQLSISGLRLRYPQANEDELRRRLADVLLGPDLAKRVYGPWVEMVSTNVE
ncbi:MAG: hypothetical protein GY759_17935 [Chloroflexi bacterium]|nr:hypothetical protein [Chloroflexota bacterium]